jgi:alcohol dehydrogenase, propanol-preferring
VSNFSYVLCPECQAYRSTGHLGIQYLKAYGYKVIGIDLSADAIEEAKAHGADYAFNPKSDTDYVQQVRSITGKGCQAAINYTNSVPAYSSAVDLLKVNGILMVTGIPQKPLQFNAMSISMNRIRVRGANNGITRQLEKCVAFSHEHGIAPDMKIFKLERFHDMLELMESGKHKGRMGVLFD